MTLLLNYRPVIHQPTGIGVYANAVLPYLLDLPHELIPGGAVGGFQHRMRRFLWTQTRLKSVAARLGASLIFTPAPEGYLGQQTCPQVVMVHDLRPLSHPAHRPTFQGLYFQFWVPALLDHCLHILTNSEFTAQQIAHFVGIPRKRISVVPLGYDTVMFTPSDAISSLAYGRYFLHVGQAYPHKNIVRLLHAFAPVASAFSDLNLLLVGKPHPTETPHHQRLVAQLGLVGRVHFLPYVPRYQLPELYRNSIALVYPSLSEGFGLPVLEAMGCGTPVITALGSATEEISGDAAILVDPTDTAALEWSMHSVLINAELRDQCRDRGLLRASLFDWQRTGLATTAVLKKLLLGEQPELSKTPC